MIPRLFAPLALVASATSWMWAMPAVVVAAETPRQPVASLEPAPRRGSPRPPEDLALLADPNADPASRAAAVKRLLSLTDPDQQRSVADLLVPTPETAAARSALIREIRAASNAPNWLVAPLARLAAESPTTEQLPIIDALGSIRSRESIRALLPFTASSSPAPVREAAFAALTRLTGRTEFGRDAAAWRTWFADVEWRSEAEWLRILNEGLAQGLDRAARERDRWITRTVEAERKAYVEGTQPAARTALLASFLRDDLAPMRRLGVELLNRELANARPIDESVSLAALGLLHDPHPDLRQAGAELASILNPPGAAAALTNALLTESDPSVAAALLRSAAASPAGSIRPVVMRWLSTPGPAQRPAMDVAAALLERSLVDPDEVRPTLLAALRSIDAAELPGSGLRMLSALGTDEDRLAVATQLASPTPARRTQAVEALAIHRDYLPRLISAAANDPALYLTVCRAIAAHDPTIDGYLAALSLPALSDNARREGLLAIVERMDRRDLLTAARRTENLTLREMVLSRLTSVPLQPPAGATGVVGPEPTVIGGLLLLAETRLELRQPAGALAAIEALSPVSAAVDPAECDRIRTVALLWLNRLDEAKALTTPLSIWLDGLELCADLAHAADILAAIDSRFTPPLADADLARLNALRERILPQMGPPAPPTAATPTSSSSPVADVPPSR